MTRRRVLAVPLLVLALLLVAAAPAAAHAGFVSSDPADGATLEASPDAIVIRFTETPDLALSSITVLDSGGQEVSTGQLAAIDEKGLVVPLPDELPDGVYTVAWEVVSTEDGHKTANSFAFGIGEAPPPPGSGGATEAITTATPLTIVAKSLFYAGTMLLLATAVVGLGLFGGRPRRLTLIGLLAGVASFAGAVALLIAEQRALDVSSSTFLDSEAGVPYQRLLALTLIGAGCAVVAAARPRWRWMLWPAGVTAIAAMGVRAFAGHAAGVSFAVPPEPTQWAHFVAAGLWVGGLLLALLLVRGTGATADLVGPIRRYSTLAAWAVLVVVLSGLARTWSQLGGPGGLIDSLDTAYGRVLLLKIVVALAIVGLGAVNRYRSIPRLETERGPLRRLLTGEVLAAGGVILLTATLTSLNPSATGDATGPSTPVLGRAEGTDFATTMRVRLALDPGTPGANLVAAEVVGYDDDLMVDADGVTLRVSSVTTEGVPPGSVELTREGDAWTGQSAAISLAGTWDVTAQVRTGSSVTEVPMVLVTRSDALDQPTPGALLETARYPSGVSLQVSLEATDPSAAFIHVTALTPGAGELPLSAASVVATLDGREARRLDAEQATPGHFIAQADLEPGTYTIDVVVTSEDGRTFQATLVDAPVRAAP
jgi:copper transport protein